MASWGPVDSEGFEALPPDLLVPPRDISREEAWRRHRQRLRLLPDRLLRLTELASANGVDVGERGERDCGSLEAWVREVATRRGDLLADPEKPLLSLVHDAGMMFGDELIARYPSLSWQLKRGSPRNLFYHFTVLMGFSRAPHSIWRCRSPWSPAKHEFLGDELRPWFANLVQTAEQYA